MAGSGGIDRVHAPSPAAKLAFAALHFTSLALCAWLLLGDGWGWIGSFFGVRETLSDPGRGIILLACAALYFLRHLLTLFYLLMRRVAFSEVLGLAPFMAVFEIGFLLLGAGAFRAEAIPIGFPDYGALALVLIGSFLNSYSELQRKWWKSDPANKGHCYTGGLFAYSMHINYFGDTVLFTGWALLTHSLIALALPAFMAASFIFFHIPALDAYLAERYGTEFEAYAARTYKFMPFVY